MNNVLLPKDVEIIGKQMVLKDFEIIDIFINDSGFVSHIYASKGVMFYLIVFPHIGNSFKYLLRRNPKNTFNRWTNADLEDLYDTAEELVENLNYEKDLEDIISLWGD